MLQRLCAITQTITYKGWGCLGGTINGWEKLQMTRPWLGFVQKQNSFGLRGYVLVLLLCILQWIPVVIIHCQRYFILWAQLLQQCYYKKIHWGTVYNDKEEDKFHSTVQSHERETTCSQGCCWRQAICRVVNRLSSFFQHKSHGTKGKKLRMFFC